MGGGLSVGRGGPCGGFLVWVAIAFIARRYAAPDAGGPRWRGDDRCEAQPGRGPGSGPGRGVILEVSRVN